MAWPTTNDPRTEFMTNRFTVGEMAEIDAAVAASGLKKSEYVRAALHRVILADRRRQAAKAATEGEPVLSDADADDQ
jgi:hypothetical protein